MKYQVAVYVYGANAPSRVYPASNQDAADKLAATLREQADRNGSNLDIRIQEA